MVQFPLQTMIQCTLVNTCTLTQYRKLPKLGRTPLPLSQTPDLPVKVETFSCGTCSKIGFRGARGLLILSSPSVISWLLINLGHPCSERDSLHSSHKLGNFFPVALAASLSHARIRMPESPTHRTTRASLEICQEAAQLGFSTTSTLNAGIRTPPPPLTSRVGFCQVLVRDSRFLGSVSGKTAKADTVCQMLRSLDARAWHLACLVRFSCRVLPRRNNRNIQRGRR